VRPAIRQCELQLGECAAEREVLRLCLRVERDASCDDHGRRQKCDGGREQQDLQRMRAQHMRRAIERRRTLRRNRRHEDGILGAHRTTFSRPRSAPVIRMPTMPAQIATSLHALRPRNGMFWPVIGTAPTFDSATYAAGNTMMSAAIRNSARLARCDCVSPGRWSTSTPTAIVSSMYSASTSMPPAAPCSPSTNTANVFSAYDTTSATPRPPTTACPRPSPHQPAVAYARVPQICSIDGI